MKIYLESIGNVQPWHDQYLLLTCLAGCDAVKRHVLEKNRDLADIVLIVFNVDPCLHNFNVKYDSRVFAYGSYDSGFPLFPGLYPSLATWNSDENFARSAAYLPRSCKEDELIAKNTAPNLLYSFVGSSLTSPLRKKVLKLQHARAYLRDTSNDDGYKSSQSAEVYVEFRKKYFESLNNSKFVLCPRGVGTSSIRLFEAMKAGRVPVIISDHWVPPKGLAWDKFSIHIKENDIESIPIILESIERSAYEMGNIAKEQWLENFSESKIFNWIVEQLIDMQKSNIDMFRFWRFFKIADPRNLRSFTMPTLKKKLKFNMT